VVAKMTVNLQEKKSYQVLLKRGVHRRLMKRARQLNFKQYQFIENLLSSFEIRLQAEVEKIRAKGLDVADEDIAEIATAIWAADQQCKGAEHYRAAIERIRLKIKNRNAGEGWNWNPEIKMPTATTGGKK
jgi:NADH dehydrogenase FAD-containing subunit